MTIDQRIEALTNLELLTRDVETLRDTVRLDGETIRALARVAEIRLNRLGRGTAG